MKTLFRKTNLSLIQLLRSFSFKSNEIQEHLLVIFIILFSYQFSFSQEFDRTNQVSLLKSRIKHFHQDSNFDKALKLLDSLLSSEVLNEEDQISFQIDKQITFYYLGQIDSMKLGLKSIETEIKSYHPSYPEYLFATCLYQGGIGNYAEAIRKLLELNSLAEKSNNQSLLLAVNNSLGANYRVLNDFVQAKGFYNKALKVALQEKDLKSTAMIFNNLGSVYRKLENSDSALYYYEEASAILTSIDSKYYLAQNLLNIGNIYEVQKDYRQAEYYFAKCLSISEEGGIRYGMLISKLNLGNLFRIKKEYQKGEDFLNEALLLAEEMSMRREKGLILERLSWIQRDRRQFKSAYELEIESKIILDALLSESVKKEALDLKAKYDAEKKEKEIIGLETKMKQLYLMGAMMLIIVIVLVICLLWISYRHKNLRQTKLLVEKEKSSLMRTIEIKDMELTSQAMQLTQIKEILKNWKLANTSKVSPSSKEGLDSLKPAIFETLKADFEGRITSSNEDFFKILLDKFPTLRPAELRLCAYLRLNISTKEIAEMLNKSIRTIETTRYSIRKKMGLDGNENLVSFLISLKNESKQN